MSTKNLGHLWENILSKSHTNAEETPKQKHLASKESRVSSEDIMLAIILKELHCYCNSTKYRRIQFLVLCVLTLLLFVATVEFYADSRTGKPIDVGKQTYTLFIIALFIVQFWVPRHAVEAWHTEGTRRSYQAHPQRYGQNGALLALTPLTNWRILAGKLSAIVVWAMWGIWLTIPLLALSNYTGGLTVAQLVRCGAVLLVSCIFYALIGVSFALWNSPIRAKSISYGLVLLITFLPLVPVSPFNAIPMFTATSPLCALLSILSADSTQLWVWNIGLFCTLFLLFFPILLKRMRS